MGVGGACQHVNVRAGYFVDHLTVHYSLNLWDTLSVHVSIMESECSRFATAWLLDTADNKVNLLLAHLLLEVAEGLSDQLSHCIVQDAWCILSVQVRTQQLTC